MKKKQLGQKKQKSQKTQQHDSNRRDRVRLRAQHKLGLNIRKAREEQGLSQEQFARLCKMHHSHVSEVERGESNVTISTIFRISSKLNTTLAELFKDVK